ncbi:T9SS type A sorting domain-containing protein [Flavobacterium sp. CYK-4]|uniref:T9SS type A sorting domain-containing protein n=1 Tax=Flavobacterium lotistagni TaxID=2709660 RepID=UPI00140CE3A3|nr:T9SS type A sorting domain-containing protein [Flavobacterium lotistagni]NHM05936.1 T9SS type A sorting domain-containing protein [Flavobacterium lotistagni]
MKKILLVPFLFFSALSFCQIGHEHTFYDGVVSRVVLENSGEKYYLYDKANSAIVFYNADYSLWKTVPISTLPNPYDVAVTHVSQTKINPDDAIEISYTSYASSPLSPQSKIVDESGAVLKSVDNCSYLHVDETGGLQVKVLAASASGLTVYSAPDFFPEHYFQANYYDIQRLRLEVSGEKYCVFDRGSGIVNLYNADYSFWKSIPLIKPQGYSFSRLYFLSEKQINDDNLIELGYGYYLPLVTQPPLPASIINENGTILKTFADVRDMWVNAVNGMSTKLFADVSQDDVIVSYRTEVYSVSDFNLEHSYSGTLKRINLDNSGEKYYIDNYNYAADQIEVYNSDHTLWKTIPVAVSSLDETITNVSVSENIIDQDNQLEVAYTINSNTLDGGHYHTNLVKEDGTVLLSLNEATAGYLSTFPGLPYKFITSVKSGPFDNTQYFSSVYGAEGSFAVLGFDQPMITLAPNPAQNSISLSSQTAIVKAGLFDIRCALISQWVATDIKTMNVEHVSSGLYFIHLENSNGLRSVHKILISR